jgi:hypothetical protein
MANIAPVAETAERMSADPGLNRLCAHLVVSFENYKDGLAGAIQGLR